MILILRFSTLATLKNSQPGRKFNKKFPGPIPRDLDTPGLYRDSDIDFFLLSFLVIWASLVAQRLKRLPAMRETWVQSLGREGALEKEMATHSSILAWRIPWTEELGGLQSTGSQRVGHD